MRVLLLGMGSRGDVQPFLALAPRLEQLGYAVSLAAPADFGPFVAGHGVAFEPLSFEVREGVESDLGRQWLRGSSTNQVREASLMRRVVRHTAHALGDDLVRLVARHDVVVSSALTFDAADSLCAAWGKPHVYAVFQPVWPSRSGVSSSFALRPHRDSLLNLAWSMLAGRTAWGIFRPPGDRVRRRVGLPRKGFRGYVGAAMRTPVLLATSPSVVPHADDWPPNVVQTGFWFREPSPGEQPPAALVDFMERGDPPVHLGFGSMPTHDPAAVLRGFVEALETVGRRGVVSAGWGGLGRDGVDPAGLPDSVLAVEGAPHEWLFPRCAAVVHHGGGGTVAAAFRAGVPQLAVPHIADQPYWGRRIHDLGVGPAAIARKDLTTARLVTALETALTAGARDAAYRLGERIRSEDGVGVAAAQVDRAVRATRR